MAKGGSPTSSNATTTQNTDKRLVVNDGVGISSDTSTVNVTSTTNALDADIVTAALDTVKSSDATNGEGFTKLLELADGLFSGAGDVIAKTQDTTLGQIAALNTTANDSKGSIDQKTLIIIVAGAAVAIYALKGKA